MISQIVGTQLFNVNLVLVYSFIYIYIYIKSRLKYGLYFRKIKRRVRFSKVVHKQEN